MIEIKGYPVTDSAKFEAIKVLCQSGEYLDADVIKEIVGLEENEEFCKIIGICCIASIKSDSVIARGAIEKIVAPKED